MMAGMKSTFPPNKVPRGNNVVTGQPMTVGSGAPSTIGRGITPSFVANQLGGFAQRASQRQAQDSIELFNSITRTVEADERHHSHSLYLRNQLVFLDVEASKDPRRGRLNSSSSITRIVGGWKIRMPKEIVTLLSLPVMNYILRLEDVISAPDTPEENWLEPVDVIRRFRFDGSVRTDAHESSNPAYRNSDIKHYTVTIDGLDGDITNIWGLVQGRQPLWLIVKRLERRNAPSEYHITPSDGFQQAPVTNMDVEYHPQPMQVVPWSDLIKMNPTTDDLRYYDELKQAYCMGIAIKVGWAQEPGNALGSRSLVRAWYDASALMDLPKIAVSINGFRSDVPV